MVITLETKLKRHYFHFILSKEYQYNKCSNQTSKINIYMYSILHYHHLMLVKKKVLVYMFSFTIKILSFAFCTVVVKKTTKKLHKIENVTQ